MYLNIRAIMLACCVLGMIAANSQTGNREKAEKRSLKKTKEIKDLKLEAGKKNIKDEIVRDEKGAIWANGLSPEPIEPPLDSSINFTDPGKQDDNNLPNNPSSNLLTSFSGLPYANVTPPDPSIAVGPNHIIQMINGSSGSLFTITNKSGTVLIPATFLDQVTGIGGFADPIAIYDHLADRFLMMEMVNVNEAGSYGLSFAISKTPDPTGAWDVFFLNTGTNLPDYPKLAMWPDAYYITANEFTNASAYAGTFAFALDRNAMLLGQPSPQAVRLRLGIQPKHLSACPVALQGNPSGAASNGLIAWMQDDAWTTADSTDADSLGVFKFNVNWSNPSLSNISFIASLPTVPFKSNVCTATRGRCIPQTGTTVTLEALQQKIMNQPVYRAFSMYEGLVMTHTTDAGNEKAGIRWYELRKNAGASNWLIGQQSTWSPDGTSRFMPSISYNKWGDIALAYNISDASGNYPGLRFTGRRNCDPINLMTVLETNIKVGSSSSASPRFGDYNHLVADPLNGNFWFTGQYMPSSQWGTHIAHFSFDRCVQVCDVPFNLYSKNLFPTSVTLAWSKATNVNFYEVEYLIANDSNWIKAGNTPSDSFNITGLLPGTDYHWRVRSVCDFGNSSWITGTFSTPLSVCRVPGALLTAQISISGAKFSWSKVTDATDYTLEYQASGSITWIDLPVTAADTSYIISGLTPSTGYNWRVKAICSPTLESNWANQSFNTLAEICNPPTGLQTTLITSSSAKLSWQAAGTNLNYLLEYQAAGATSWISLPIAAGTVEYQLNGLSPLTSYNWRVRTACTTVQSGWVGLSFTTTAVLCQPPAGLTATDITAGSVQLNWAVVQGATSYRVEYKRESSTTWTLLSASTTASTAYLSGLSASTNYNWRVSATCPQNTTGFSQASFTTTGSCSIPGSRSTSNITSTSATLSWGSVSGSLGYRVEYKLASAATWTVMPNTTSRSVTLTGLLPVTAYQWRVRNICSAGTSAPSDALSFTTLAIPCPDAYEPNNSKSAPKAIPVNTDIFAAIGSGSDVDWFSFNNTSTERNIRITLSQLPANYSITLYNTSGTSVVTSAKTGTVDEIISYNTSTVGKYLVRVFPASTSVFDPSKCYKLRVNIQSGTNAPELDITNNVMTLATTPTGMAESVNNENVTTAGNLLIYPNPASDRLFLQYPSDKAGKSTASIMDQTGRRIGQKILSGIQGESIDISSLLPGMYILQVKTEKGTFIRKFLVNR